MALWDLGRNDEASLWHLTIAVGEEEIIFFYSDLIIYSLARGIFFK